MHFTECTNNGYVVSKSSMPLSREMKKLRFFLVADMQLFKRLCPSVGPSVCWSVGLLVRRSSVIKLKSGKTNVLDTFCVCLSVGGGLGYEWGLNAPAHPSATIL